MSFVEYCNSRSRGYLLFMALIGVLIVGFFDYITGYEISFFLFYSGPILFCVWFLGLQETILIVLISGIVWWWADWKAGHPYFASWMQIWETSMRLGFFTFVAIGGTAMKARKDSMEKLVENMQRLRELEHDLVAASEREQQRIGADLHDGLCQYLAGVTCAAGSLRDELAERFQPEAESAAELHELMKDAVVQARNIARGIAPVHMDEAGLVSALEEMSASMAKLHDIECNFMPEGEVLVANRDVATNLYRIAQEAASNAVRHGHATAILVRLGIDEGHVTLSVDDDGIGIGPEEPKSAGMGLRSMRYRANVLNGALEITSLPEGGTRVSCRAPLPEENSIHAS